MVTKHGDSGPNQIQGTNGSDRLFGEGGDDTLSGLGGADLLIGGSGRDTLHGGADKDRLFGEGGNDILRGGAGADTFFCRSVSHGVDRVEDFDLVSGDKLDLRQALIPNYGSGDDIRDFVHARTSGGSTIVSIDPTGQGVSFTDVFRLDGRVIGINQLAAYGMNAAPLNASQILAVQEDPFNFSDASNTDADPAITPNGRFVAFASYDNVDDDPRDITPVNPEPGVNPDPFPTPDVFVKDFRSGAVLRVSVDADGHLARTENGELAPSFSPAVSANGRLVAFATNGVLTPTDQDPDTPEDTNNSGDVYLKNLTTGDVTLVSADTAGHSGGVPLLFGPFGNGPPVAMSDNGRFVAFMTIAPLDTHLAETTDGNTLLDVYVRNLRNDKVFLVSMDDRGQARGVSDPNNSETPIDGAIDMSADGRFVAFTTAAMLNGDDGDTNQADVYLWDRLQPLSAPMLVSGAAQGSPQDFSESSNPSISADGRFVAFESSTALVADDTNGVRDIYRWDRLENETVRVSTDADGRQTALYDSFSPSISADGRFVAFSSAAGDLVSDDTSFSNTSIGSGFAEDIFVKDIDSGSITRASVDDNGGQGGPFTTSFSPSLSADASLVTFLTDAPNILQSPADFPNDTVVLTAVDFDVPRAVDIPGAASISLSDFALRSTIDAPDDQDWFKSFAFGTVAIDLEGSATGQGTLADPRVRVFRIAEDGSRVVAFENDDGGIGRNAHLEFRPSESDDYFISAEGFGGETGTYRLRVLNHGFDVLGNQDTDSTLVPGAPDPTQGKIDATFDADWYRVQLSVGQSYRFELRSDVSNSTPLTDPLLEIRDGAGTLLASDDDSGGEGLNALLDFEAPGSGMFFVAALGVGEATGDYLLTGDVLPAPVTAPLPLRLTEALDTDPGAGGAGLGLDSTTVAPIDGANAPAALTPGNVGGALSNLLGEPGDAAAT